jgi:hypothetical protein
MPSRASAPPATPLPARAREGYLPVFHDGAGRITLENLRVQDPRFANTASFAEIEPAAYADTRFSAKSGTFGACCTPFFSEIRDAARPGSASFAKRGACAGPNSASLGGLRIVFPRMERSPRGSPNGSPGSLPAPRGPARAAPSTGSPRCGERRVCTCTTSSPVGPRYRSPGSPGAPHGRGAGARGARGSPPGRAVAAPAARPGAPPAARRVPVSFPAGTVSNRAQVKIAAWGVTR